MNKTGREVAGNRRQRSGNRRPKLIAPRLQTVFSLPPGLLAHRILNRLAAPLFRQWLYALSLGSGGDKDAPLGPVPEKLWPGSYESGQQIMTGLLRLDGQTIADPDPLSQPPGADLTWRQALHRFDWLPDLAALATPEAAATARALVARWVRENARYGRLSWRLDILAARLRQILLHHSFLGVNDDAAFRAQLIPSLHRQALHLSRALPGGLAGGALLEAVVSLMLAGLILPRTDPKAARLLARGHALLVAALPRQFLADGGHVERSPALMLRLLQHLIDLRDCLVLAHAAMPDHLQIAIGNLASATAMLCHNDGRLALFNDSQEGDEAAIRMALARAGEGKRTIAQLPITGFQRLERGRTVVIADCGVPPRHGLDDRAHAGTLSFELSHRGARMVVNCGAHPWSADWRDAQRTTAAHSALVVDNTNSSMLLPGAGLALRPGIVTSRREETDGNIWLDLSHDGYEESFGLIHRRRLYLAASGEEFAGEDRLVGKGGNQLALRFHLHPSVHASVTQNGQAAVLLLADGSGWRFRVQGGSIDLAESVYLGSEGRVRRSQQLIVLDTIEGDDTEIKWTFQREGGKRPA